MNVEIPAEPSTLPVRLPVTLPITSAVRDATLKLPSIVTSPLKCAFPVNVDIPRTLNL